MTVRTPVLFAGLALAGGAVQARAQAVQLRITPPVGQVTHYRTTSQTWIQMPGMPAGDTSQPTMTQTLFTTRTVTALEGTTRTMTTVVDSSRQELPGMGAMTGMGPGDMLRGMITTQRVDPRGNVLSSEITPPPGAPPMIAQAMRQGGQAGSRSATVMPERALRPGETWTDSMTMPFGGQTEAGQAVFLITYKLERLERQGAARIAVVSWAGTVRSDAGAARGASGSMTGQVSLDLDAGRMVSSTTEMNITTRTAQGTAPMRSKATMEALP